MSKKKKKEVIRKISACIKNKFNGFTMTVSNSREIEIKDFFPVDIIYKHVRSPDDVMEYFFSTNTRLAYRGTHSDLKSRDRLGHSKPYKCYYCSHFTFEDNLNCKGDIPYCVYADFETSAPTDDCLDPENRIMFAVSYALVLAWNPKLKLDRQVVVRGFNHSLEELGDMSYLSSEQLALRNQKTAEQLNDAVANVYRKKKKDAIVEMFNIELKFACDILKRWFQYKIKPNKISLSNIERINYSRNNLVTTESKYCICKFRLDVMPKCSN